MKVFIISLLSLSLLLMTCSDRDTFTQRTIQANSLYKQAKTCYLNGNYKEALTYSFELERVAKIAGYKKGLGDAYHLLGTIYKAKKENGLALENYLNALLLKEKQDDSLSLSKTYNNLGNLYADHEFFEKAIFYFERSISLKEKLNDPVFLENSYHNLALTYADKKDFNTALTYFNKSLTLRKDMGDQNTVAHTYNNIAIRYMDSGKYTTALENFEQALILWQDIGKVIKVADTYNNISIIYELKNEYPKVLEYANKAIEMYEKYEVEEEIISTCNTISSSYYKLDSLPKALKYTQKSMALAKKYDIRDELMIAYENASIIYTELKEFEKSNTYLWHLKTMQDSIATQQKEIYDITIKDRNELVQAEKKFEVVKAEILRIEYLRTERQRFFIIFLGVVLFAVAGVHFAGHRYRTLLHTLRTFPPAVQKALSQIAGISFIARVLPEQVNDKLDELDKTIDHVSIELDSFMARVKRGAKALEEFDTIIPLIEISKRYKKMAEKKHMVILTNIDSARIFTNRRLYLQTVEQLLLLSIRYGLPYTSISLTAWTSDNSYWLTITDIRNQPIESIKENSLLKKLEDLGGIISTRMTGGKHEITLVFDLVAK